MGVSHRLRENLKYDKFKNKFIIISIINTRTYVVGLDFSNDSRTRNLPFWRQTAIMPNP